MELIKVLSRPRGDFTQATLCLHSASLTESGHFVLMGSYTDWNNFKNQTKRKLCLQPSPHLQNVIKLFINNDFMIMCSGSSSL